MSVWVHKQDENGETVSELVDALHLDSALSAGYVVDKDELTGEAPQHDGEPGIDDVLRQSAGGGEEPFLTDPGSDKSAENIRQAAKLAGIEGWDNKRIKTLKIELGYVD